MIAAPLEPSTPLPIADYARCLLSIAETVHCWLSSLSVLDEKRRARVAAYAEKIAATLERAGEALRRLEAAPDDRGARERAVRELGRISGYIETMVDALEHHLDGRKLTGVKRRLELLRPGELHKMRGCRPQAYPHRPTGLGRGLFPSARRRSAERERR